MPDNLEFEETFESLLTNDSIPPEDPRRSFGVCRGCDPPTKGFYDPPSPPQLHGPRPCCLDMLRAWADLTPSEILSLESLAREVRGEVVRAAQGMKRTHRLIKSAILEWDANVPKMDGIIWNPSFGGTRDSIIQAGRYPYGNPWEVRPEGRIHTTKVDPGESTTVAVLSSLEQIAKRDLYVQQISLQGEIHIGFIRIGKVSNRVLRKVRG